MTNDTVIDSKEKRVALRRQKENGRWFRRCFCRGRNQISARIRRFIVIILIFIIIIVVIIIIIIIVIIIIIAERV